jgi:hypothetical protein
MNVLTFRLAITSSSLMLAIGLYASGASFGQTASSPNASAPPASSSSFCASPSIAYAVHGNQDEAMALIREKCKRGDTVSLPGDNASMVARFCDFSRTIILKGRDPDSYIGSQLKEAGRWPPEGKLKASSALPR